MKKVGMTVKRIKCPTCGGDLNLVMRPIPYPQGFANCDIFIVCKTCKTKTRDLLKYSDKEKEG